MNVDHLTQLNNSVFVSRLHVAMFTNVYRPLSNGVVTSVASFRRGLVERGHVVYVMAPHAPEDHRDEERFVFRYPALELPLQRYPLTLPVSPFVDHLLPRLQPDILHAHHPVMLGRVAAKKSRQLRIPLVFTYHTRYHEYSHYVKGVPEHLVKEFLENWLAHFMRRCHHVIVPSHSIRLMLEDIYGISKRVSVLATGVELAQFGQLTRQQARRELGWSLEPLTVVSVGRLAKEKNWELMLRAFREVAIEEPSVQLTIVGGGEEKGSLERFCAELGIAEQVTFTGPVLYEEISTYLSACDIFCFASVTETQGLATLEAMASGLPVVAVEASGTSDVVTHGKEGFLTACDYKALGAQLRRLVTDRELRESFGQAGRKHAGGYSVESQSACLEEIYRVALADYEAGYRVPVQTDESTTGLRKFFSYFNRDNQVS
ncbi:MAG: glycosyltransferase [Candidatus Eremiobacteraeota bacterium]|nr:glycosyltransferase [Candidatus Eremiobacteraeota bacterium]